MCVIGLSLLLRTGSEWCVGKAQTSGPLIASVTIVHLLAPGGLCCSQRGDITSECISGDNLLICSRDNVCGRWLLATCPQLLTLRVTAGTLSALYASRLTKRRGKVGQHSSSFPAAYTGTLCRGRNLSYFFACLPKEPLSTHCISLDTLSTCIAVGRENVT